MSDIQIIAAMSLNRCIGLNNSIPWKIPEDMAHFKRTTLGHTVVMGRKTFESMGNKPLPKRKNIVLTRDRNFKADGVEVCHDYKEILRLKEKIFIIGGEEIYRLFIDDVDGMILTLINENLDGDTFFPEFIPNIDYRQYFEEEFRSVNGYDGKFIYFQKIKINDSEVEMMLPELDFFYINRGSNEEGRNLGIKKQS